MIVINKLIINKNKTTVLKVKEKNKEKKLIGSYARRDLVGWEMIASGNCQFTSLKIPFSEFSGEHVDHQLGSRVHHLSEPSHWYPVSFLFKLKFVGGKPLNAEIEAVMHQ